MGNKMINCLCLYMRKAIPFGLQHVLAMFVANLAPVLIVCSAALVRGILEQYEKLMDYCAEYGLKISGNPIEEYMISCANICGSENYITNVMFPIELPE